jgi:hypothetical protein
MVKTEMSLLTGFSKPEKYLQVRRERASDGKFYSKIDEKIGVNSFSDIGLPEWRVKQVHESANI